MILDDLAAPGWLAEAACAGSVSSPDDDPWFPEGDGGAVYAMTQRAKAVCAGCAVRSLCLDLSIAEGHRDGVWGGLSPNERADLKRERAA